MPGGVILLTWVIHLHLLHFLILMVLILMVLMLDLELRGRRLGGGVGDSVLEDVSPWPHLLEHGARDRHDSWGEKDGRPLMARPDPSGARRW